MPSFAGSEPLPATASRETSFAGNEPLLPPVASREVDLDKEAKQVHQESKKKCDELWRSLGQGGAGNVNQRLPCLFQYRKCWVSACAIHVAVYDGDRDRVEQLLDRNADLNAVATYTFFKPEEPPERDRSLLGLAKEFCRELVDAVWFTLTDDGDHVKQAAVYSKSTVYLKSVHMAAGHGTSNVLELLLSRHADPNSYSKVETQKVCVAKLTPEDLFERTVARIGEEEYNRHKDYYTPLHEAAWYGNEDTLKKLLELDRSTERKEGRLRPDCDGKTALHLLVEAGQQGRQRKRISKLLDLLLWADDKASADVRDKMLELRSSNDVEPRSQANCTPLELAVATGQFPMELAHKLVRSNTALDGLLTLTKLSMSSTEALADKLKERMQDENEKLELLRCMQSTGAVDKLARLLHKAPTAAVALLDSLTSEDPEVQDSKRWPLPISAMMNADAHSDYQYDACNYPRSKADVLHGGDTFSPGQLLWPMWKYNSQKSKPPHWHSKLAPRPLGSAGLEEGVSDVCVKVLLIPSIVDIDILWALARTLPKDYFIFARLAMRGIVGCMWHQLVKPVYLFNLTWRLFELLALATWGLAGTFVSLVGEDRGEHVSEVLPVCWSLLWAALIQECVDNFYWIYNHFRKRHEYHRSHGKGRALHMPLVSWARMDWMSLWSVQSFFRHTGFLFHLTETSLLLFVLWNHAGRGRFNLTYGVEQVEAGELALALTLFFRALGFLENLRVCSPFGKKIVTAMNSLLSFSMVEMAVTMAFIFGAIWCVFMVVIGSRHNPGYVALYLYRGLIFGDGDGLDNLGLNPSPEEGETKFHHNVMTAFMGVASGLFQLVILNLIVNPIYGSEYDNIQQEASLVMDRERASLCCQYILSKKPREAMHKKVDSFFLQHFPIQDTRNALQLAAAVAILIGGLLIVFWPNQVTVFLSAALLACGKILINHVWMDCDWFADVISDPDAVSNSLGPGRFLWICHRADYNERWCIANDPLDKGDLEKLTCEIKRELRDLRRQLRGAHAEGEE